MKWVRAHCHVVDHPKFLTAGAVARDLWQWGMLYCGKHELDGEIPMDAVLLNPWGAGGKKNVVIAQKLCDLGLWERTDKGYRICKWAEMGNPTKAQLDEKRREEAEGRAARRSKSKPPPPIPEVSVDVSAPDNVPDNSRTPERVPYSYSYSDSSGSAGGKTVATSERPASAVQLRADPQQPAPDWWPGVIDTIDMDTGVRLPAAEAWLRYAGHRGDKHRPAERGHAIYWLTSVMVKEARDKREADRRQAERDEKFDRERAARPSSFRPPEPEPAPYHRVSKPPKDAEPAATPEQAAAMSRKIAGMFR